MTKKTESLLPLSLARVRRRFEAWRLRKRPGARIPEALWAKAVEAAREHGLARTSQALRLDYYTLKARMEKASSPQVTSQPKPAFQEVIAPIFSTPAECLLEVEAKDGARRRAHLKGDSLPTLCALARAFLEGGAPCSR